jgi:hypothetical protein
MPTYPTWKLVLRLGLILVFGATGLGRMFWPDHFIRPSSGLDSSRTSVRWFGAIYIALVALMLYSFLIGR